MADNHNVTDLLYEMLGQELNGANQAPRVSQEPNRCHKKSTGTPAWNVTGRAPGPDLPASSLAMTTQPHNFESAAIKPVEHGLEKLVPATGEAGLRSRFDPALSTSTYDGFVPTQLAASSELTPHVMAESIPPIMCTASEMQRGTEVVRVKLPGSNQPATSFVLQTTIPFRTRSKPPVQKAATNTAGPGSIPARRGGIAKDVLSSGSKFSGLIGHTTSIEDPTQVLEKDVTKTRNDSHLVIKMEEASLSSQTDTPRILKDSTLNVPMIDTRPRVVKSGFTTRPPTGPRSQIRPRNVAKTTRTRSFVRRFGQAPAEESQLSGEVATAQKGPADPRNMPCHHCHFVHRGIRCETSCIGCRSTVPGTHGRRCRFAQMGVSARQQHRPAGLNSDTYRVNKRSSPATEITWAGKLSAACQRQRFNPIFELYSKQTAEGTRHGCKIRLRDTFVIGEGAIYISVLEAKEEISKKALSAVNAGLHDKPSSEKTAKNRSSTKNGNSSEKEKPTKAKALNSGVALPGNVMSHDGQRGMDRATRNAGSKAKPLMSKDVSATQAYDNNPRHVSRLNQPVNSMGVRDRSLSPRRDLTRMSHEYRGRSPIDYRHNSVLTHPTYANGPGNRYDYGYDRPRYIGPDCFDDRSFHTTYAMHNGEGRYRTPSPASHYEPHVCIRSSRYDYY